MKALFAVIALALAVGASANTVHEGSKAAPWLVAQYDRRLPTCKQEERNVPSGTTICREGNLMVCNGRGNWESTAKPC